MRNLVVIVIVLSVVLGILFWRFSDSINNWFNQPKGNEQITLVWWGLQEEELVYRPLIEAYEKDHPNVKISYVKQSAINYRPRLQTQLRAGQGPDIFMIHSSWVPMFTGDLAAAPEATYTAADFSQNYYPIITHNLVVQNRVYGIPMEIDGLAMYYNEDLLKYANVSLPKTWQQFQDGARKITVKNQQGQIETAGAALGTTTNVDHWPEILGLLFAQQPEGNVASPGNKGGGDILRFYTSFITDPQNKTWDVTLPSSTQMFTEGKLAFYFANAKKAQDLRQANPSLNFKVAPVPQLPGGEQNWGGFWTYAVAVKPNFAEAWQFLKYLSSPQSAQILYQQQTQNGSVGTAFPRKDMADLLVNDPFLGAYIKEAPTMNGWFLNSDFSDAGINDEVIALYQEAINSVLQGADPQKTLEGMDVKIKQSIDKYTSLPTPTIKK